MKEICKLWASYNVWANQKMVEMILLLTEEEQQRILPSSIESIFKTLLHIWDAESAWWQRMKLQEQIIIPSISLNPITIADVTNGLIQQSKQWNEWVSKASDAALDHIFAYQNTKKEHFKQPIYQMLMHVFNHGTYHRGQLVNMCRQLGKDKIVNTDFIAWSRSVYRLKGS